MNFKKLTLATALMAATSVASAANVTSVIFGDYNNDGLTADFNFGAAPTGDVTAPALSNNTWSSHTAVSTGVAATGFTDGFDFGGTGQFVPALSGTGIISDITGTDMTFSSLEFGGEYNGGTFALAPDSLTPGTGDSLFGGFDPVTNTVTWISDGYNAVVEDLGAGQYGFVVKYVATIAGTGTSFDGQRAFWRLEGVASTTAATAEIPSAVPVPAAVWLFGSGLVGLAGIARRRKAA